MGTPKSGTTSIGKLFLDGFRADHEPNRRHLVRVMNRHFHRKMSDPDYVRFLRRRDKELWLDLESNCFLGYRTDLLASAFPDASYILTIREPSSWLRSMLDNHLDYPPRPGTDMAQWHGVFFPVDGSGHATPEQGLADRGLYPLHRYLEYWVAHNRGALDALGERRLLRVGTRQISERLDEVASFLGIDSGRLEQRASHANKTSSHHDVVQELDPSWVGAEVDRVCAAFIEEYGLAPLFRSG